MAEILDVLGWKFARSGSKAHPFASAFDVLGVSIDLSKLYEGIVTLKNKQSRVDALVAAIDRLVYEGRVESGVASHGWTDNLKPDGSLSFCQRCAYTLSAERNFTDR